MALGYAVYAVQRCTPSTNDRNTALQNDRIEPFFGFDGSLQKGFLSPFLFSMDQSPISKTICPSKINVTVSIGPSGSGLVQHGLRDGQGAAVVLSHRPLVPLLPTELWDVYYFLHA